jgi:hypothetical protein
MSLFGNREERIKRNREKYALKEQQKRNKYLEENKIQDIYTEENKTPMDVIIDMSQAKGTIPVFQDSGIRTIYAEQLVLEAQNWMQIRQNDRLIKQNDEIIKLLKENNK